MEKKMPKNIDTRSLQSSIGSSFSRQISLSDHQVRRLREERTYQNDDVAPDTLDILIAKEEVRSRIRDNIIPDTEIKPKVIPGKPYKPPLKTDCTIHTHTKNRRTGDKTPITRGRISPHLYYNYED